MTRADGRSNDQLREVRFTRGWLSQAEGSVLVEYGQTRVLVAARMYGVRLIDNLPLWPEIQGLGTQGLGTQGPEIQEPGTP